MACAYPTEPDQYTTRTTENAQSADFTEQITETRAMIMKCFKRLHEALQEREEILLSDLNQIENEYNAKMKEMQELVEALGNNKEFCCGNLKATKLDRIRQEIMATIDREIAELTADTDSSIELEWDSYSFELYSNRL